MERPSWATVIGILMILFGGCGAFNDIKQINSPALIQFQDELLVELSTETDFIDVKPEELERLKKIAGDTTTVNSDSLSTADQVVNSIRTLTHIPDSTIDKLVTYGYVGLFVSALYIIAGILLFKMRKHILKVVFGTLVLSLIFFLVQVIHLSQDDLSKVFKFGLNFALFFGAILDAVLLIILLLSDKAYFKNEPLVGDYYDD